MGETNWWTEISLSAGFVPFHWQLSAERCIGQFVLRIGPFWFGASVPDKWIAPSARPTTHKGERG